jgi:hypothetical protein
VDGGGASASVVVFADDAFAGDLIVLGMPHISDSVEFTKLSFGLLGSHIAAFCCGVNDDVIFDWPWATLNFPNSVNITIAAAMMITIARTLRNASFLDMLYSALSSTNLIHHYFWLLRTMILQRHTD